MSEKIDLSKLTDKQEILITRFAYANIKLDDNRSMTVTELKEQLRNTKGSYFGKLGTDVTGHEVTEYDILDEMEKEGLGNLRIDSIANKSSGFFAIAIKDEVGNTGITYRGTDAYNIEQLGKDLLLADVEEHIFDESQQVEEAREFFAKNADANGKNYIYGYSLGGNLAEHIYAENHESITKTTVFNPASIRQETLDEKALEAFNNPDKFRCNIIGGDQISQLKNYDKYENNIRYIYNNGKYKKNFISDHLLESATFDEKGNAITGTKEQVYEGKKHGLINVGVRVAKKAANKLNKSKFLGTLYNKTKNFIRPITKKTVEFWGKFIDSCKNFFSFKKTTSEIKQAEEIKQTEIKNKTELYSKKNPEKKKLKELNSKLRKLKAMITKKPRLNQIKPNEQIVNDQDTFQSLDWLSVLKEKIKNNTNMGQQFQQETEIILDTSGSINETLLKNFLRKCKNILPQETLKAGCFNTNFYGFNNIYTEEDINNMQFVGGNEADFNKAISSFSTSATNKLILTEANIPNLPTDTIWITFGNKNQHLNSEKVIQIDEEALSQLCIEYSNNYGQQTGKTR